MRLITIDDIIDIYSKLMQRGGYFLLSKLNFNSLSRTKSAFDNSAISHSNWWIIPKVKERWNELISGNKEVNYRQFLMQNFLKDKKDLKLISCGSGYCGHELELAEYSNFKEITCVDIAENRLKEAEQTAKEKNLNNMKFVCSSLDDFNFIENNFDVVLFNASLHHFKNVNDLLKNKIKYSLKESGKLVVNEYVGATRLQFSKHQIKEINKALKLIPEKYRKRFKTNFTKSNFYGSGIIRMIMADPSECIDSENILPAIHNNFTTIIEKNYGGNILMNALKDISHHFVELNPEKEEILNELFNFEDEYLKNNQSDLVFGIYEK